MPTPQRLSRKEYQQKRKEAKFYGLQVLLTLHQLRRYIEHASNLITTIDHPDLIYSAKLYEALGLADYPKYLKEEIFPEALHYSFIILLYGVIETSLKRTCDLVHEMRQTPLRAKDLSGGDTLSKCMTFLHKLGDVPSDSIRSLPHITDLAKVRNCIVHASGFMEGFNDKDKRDLQQLAKNWPDLIQLRDEGDPGDTWLVLSLKYCKVSVEHALSFFEELFTARRLISAREIKRFKKLVSVL